MIKHLNKKIQNAIQIELFKAKGSIRIAVSWFTNELLLHPLILKLQSGVSVELIINDDEINKGGENSLDFSDFIANGGKLMWNTSKQLMHEKFCIIDDRIVITGSYNWTNKAEFNHEDVTFFYDEAETTLFYNKNFRTLLNQYENGNFSPTNRTNTIRYEVKGCIEGDFFVDRVGAKYSKNKKILIRGANVEKYVVDANTEIIDKEAFRNCTSLDTIVLNNVIEIKEHAFLNCFSLQSLVIPDSVTNIKSNAFQGCKNIKRIKVSENNPIYDSRDNCNAIIETYANKLVIACNISEIPPSVTEIGERAFSGCELLRNLALPDTISAIGERAFSNCKLLQSIALPDTIRTIGPYAFEGCEAIESIVLSNSLTCIKEGTFCNCLSLQEIIIPNNVETIGESAFSGCEFLRSIIIPDSIQTIGKYAFSGSELLKRIEIPSSVTIIEEGAFCFCSSLESIIIPNSVTTIGAGAFEGCISLKVISIPKSVTSIGNVAFRGCTSLTSVSIPNTVTCIGLEAFCGCTGLTSVTIPNSVTSIESEAFRDCSGLTSITIPNSVTSIGYGAFYGCSGLTSITIPNSATSIGGEAFCDCSRLTSIIIPNSVTILGSSAFSGCSGLTSVTIPNSVTTIGSSAFEGCTSLTSITIPKSVKTIDSKAFSGCYGLTSVTIHSGVTSIGAWAFQYCSSLKNLRIPDSVRTIDYGTFKDCSSLESIKIPNGIATIGKNAFKGCSSIKKVTLPSTLDCTELGFEIDLLVADSIIYSDIPKNSQIIKGGNQEVCFSHSNISRFNTIDVKLDFRNCDKKYICFGKEKYLLNRFLEERSGKSIKFIFYKQIIGLLYKENMEISILVSPMRKFVFKIGNNPKFEWQGFDIVGTPIDIKQFWVNLLIEGLAYKNNNSNLREGGIFNKDEIIDFTSNNVSLCFSPDRLRHIKSYQRDFTNFIFFERSNNNGDRRPHPFSIMVFHKSGRLVDDEDPDYPFVTDRIVDNYSSEVGQFFEKCPSVLVFIAALVGCKLHCVEVKKYRITKLDPNNKDGVDYDGRYSYMASFPMFEFVGQKPIIKKEWLGQDGNRRAAEYIVEHFYSSSLNFYSLRDVFQR